MYQILCDNNLIYDLRDESLTAVEPVLTQEINSAGSLTFTFMPDHPYYDRYTKLKSVITVLQDGTEIWSGRVLTDSLDFFKRKKVTCEGELAYLNDSIQRPGEYHDITVRQFLELMVSSHNSQVDASRQFTVGAVTVSDSNNSLYRYLNYESTYEAIKAKLMDRLGGFLFIRKEGGVRYLDYLKDYPGSVNQAIEFGENLLDFSKNYDASSVATAIIPLGCTLDNSGFTSIQARLTIESVNGGLDYVQDDAAVATYGRIFATQTWDDVTTPDALIAKGREYLASGQWEQMTLECTAIDLNLTDKDLQSLKVGYTARITSAPHGMDAIFPVYKKTINFEAPQNDTVTFSYAATQTLSSLTVKGNNDTTEKITQAYSSALSGAKANATELINSSLHGYVVMNDADGDGAPDEILIMDSEDPEIATKVWRWNSNGLGYSSTGYRGPYGLAMTIDGQIVADFITAGELSADRIHAGLLSSNDGKSFFNLDTGQVQLKGDITSGDITKGGSVNLEGGRMRVLYDGVETVGFANTSDVYGGYIRISRNGSTKAEFLAAPGAYGTAGTLKLRDQNSDVGLYIDGYGTINMPKASESFIYVNGGGYRGFSWKTITCADGTPAMVLCHPF